LAISAYFHWLRWRGSGSGSYLRHRHFFNRIHIAAAHCCGATDLLHKAVVVA
jgi:hypothetical protein